MEVTEDSPEIEKQQPQVGPGKINVQTVQENTTDESDKLKCHKLSASNGIRQTTPVGYFKSKLKDVPEKGQPVVERDEGTKSKVCFQKFIIASIYLFKRNGFDS